MSGNLIERAALGLTIALSLLAAACSDDALPGELFQATLSGLNEVPPRSTAALGAAALRPEGSSVSYRVEVTSLSGVTGAHIHTGAVGANGPVRVNLLPQGAPAGTVQGILASGSFGAADLVGISFEELLAAMRSGGAYVNVHTAAFPDGEIRGQVQVVD